jgi:hypothetical protein
MAQLLETTTKQEGRRKKEDPHLQGYVKLLPLLLGEGWGEV